MSASHKKSIQEILGRHPVHPFPARMAPGIALDALASSRKRLRVLDPMMGSGTVLAVARAKGHQAVGTDLDPLSVLLARVWTTTVDASRVRRKANEVLGRARVHFKQLPAGAAYPSGADAETRQFVRYWFDGYARRQLTALSGAIGRVRDRKVRDVLWCAFSRLIITKSAGASLAMDLSHSRPHREHVRAPVKPFNRFLAAVEMVVSNCPQQNSRRRGPAAKTIHGDARNLKMASGSIDLVLTSPPYLNAIDYLRCSKFSLVWIGYSIEEIRLVRGSSIGAEATRSGARDDSAAHKLIAQLRLRPKLSNRNNALLVQYIGDMICALLEVSRVLKRRGRAVYVVGESTVRGTYIRNSKIVTAAAQYSGLKLVSRRSRTLPANRRYLPPPKRRTSPQAFAVRMRREIILVFRK